MPTRPLGPLAPPLSQIEPMLFAEAKRPFDDPAYIHEVKYDGWRLLVEIDNGRVELKTRGGTDVTRWFPEIPSSLAAVHGGRHVFDGELCVLDEIGRADFRRLQARARLRSYRPGCDPVVFCAFDLLVLAGQDIRALPLQTRKAQLKRLLRKQMPSVLLVTNVPGEEGTWLYQRMVELQAEGIVSKRLDSVYLSGQRSSAWMRVKRPGATSQRRFKRA